MEDKDEQVRRIYSWPPKEKRQPMSSEEKKVFEYWAKKIVPLMQQNFEKQSNSTKKTDM